MFSWNDPTHININKIGGTCRLGCITKFFFFVLIFQVDKTLSLQTYINEKKYY